MKRNDGNALKSVQAALAGALPPLEGAPDWRMMRRPDGAMVEPFAIVSSIVAPPPVDDDLRYPLVTLPVTIGLYLPQRATAVAAYDEAVEIRDLLWDLFLGGAHGAVAPRRLPLYDWAPRARRDRFTVQPPRWATTGQPTGVALEYGSGTVLVPIPLSVAGEAVATASAVQALGAGARVVRRTTLQFDLVWADALAGAGGPPEDVRADGAWPVKHEVVLAGAPAPWRGASDVLRVESWAAQVVPDQDEPTKAMVMGDLRCTFRRGMAVPSRQTYVRRIGVRMDPME